MKALKVERHHMEVLLVEDSPGDVRLTREAFRDAEMPIHLTIILTTSETEADIIKSYQLQAHCYLSKPVQWEAFESLVGSISDFWSDSRLLGTRAGFT